MRKQTQKDTGSGLGERDRHFVLFGQAHRAEPLDPGLHVVATPIGNLRDISLRALATLAGAEAILAEDTRTSGVLLKHYGITTPLLPYHEHNAAQMRPQIVARLQAGQALALISDAGTPLISDPGYKLVHELAEAKLAVIGVPGASALLCALVVAGLPTDRFFFEGFLPVKQAARRQRLHELAAIPGTLIFYESPRRVAETLADMALVLGVRDAVLARELTKHFETIRRASLADLAQQLAQEETPKGEIVLMLGPASQQERQEGAQLDALLKEALGKYSLKDAASVVAQASGLPRRQVYARALELNAEG